MFDEEKHPRDEAGKFTGKIKRDEHLVQFAIDAIDGKIPAFQEYITGKISHNQRQRIEEAIGYPFDAAINIISADRIIHINKRHGRYGQAGGKTVDIADYGLMQYVLETGECKRVIDPNGRSLYSKQFRDGRGNPAPLVMFTKRIDKEYIVVEAVCDGTKSMALRVESMYTKK